MLAQEKTLKIHFNIDINLARRKHDSDVLQLVFDTPKP